MGPVRQKDLQELLQIMVPQVWSLDRSWMNCRGKEREGGQVGTLQGVKQWGEIPVRRTSRLYPDFYVGIML